MFAIVCTRPDISHPASVVSRYMVDGVRYNIGRQLNGHCGLKRALKDVGLVLSRDRLQHEYHGLSELNYARGLDKRWLTTGYIFTPSKRCCELEVFVTEIGRFPTTKVEYMAQTKAMQEAIWLKG